MRTNRLKRGRKCQQTNPRLYKVQFIKDIWTEVCVLGSSETGRSLHPKLRERNLYAEPDKDILFLLPFPGQAVIFPNLPILLPIIPQSHS